MIRILLLVGFIFYSLPSLAKIETATGKYSYTEDEEISKPESCRRAKAKAKLKAIEQAIGQTISSDELSICNEVDGKSNCERNQFSLFEFNAIVKLINTAKENWYPKDESGIKLFVCEVEIKADVKPIKKINDPNFDFSVKLNNYNFRAKEELEIDIVVNKEMYLTIFQIWPYEDPKNFQVKKLFPDKEDQVNTFEQINKFKPGSINLKYEVFLPEGLKKKVIDEYLFFIASEENIEWLPEYETIDLLKTSFHDSKYKMKYTYKGYTLIK